MCLAVICWYSSGVEHYLLKLFAESIVWVNDEPALKEVNTVNTSQVVACAGAWC